MGAGLMTRRASQRNDDIDLSLENEKKLIANRVTLLLLGAGESGKSTLGKQMRIIHEQGFTAEHRIEYKSRIHGNVMQAVISILETMRLFGFEFSYAGSESDIQRVLSFSGFVELEKFGITTETADAIERLWADAAMKTCAVQMLSANTDSADFTTVTQIDDSADYYLDNIHRITQDEYIPSEPDVLRSRLQTVGVLETHFHYNGYTFKMYDVGGQRSERRKWIHFFDNVSAVIFTVAMSGYDQVLREDPSKNRLRESLELFDWVCSQHAFNKTSFLLFLNKKDIFRRKITVSPLTVCFPDYAGAQNYEQASKYIADQFTKISRAHGKEIYTHFTNATDTADMEEVFRDATSVIGFGVETADVRDKNTLTVR